MSVVDELLAAADEAGPVSDLMAEHLDAHPLPVDEAELRASSRALHRRVSPPSRGWQGKWALGLGLVAAAAAALLWWRADTPAGGAAVPSAAPDAVMKLQTPPSARVQVQVQDHRATVRLEDGPDGRYWRLIRPLPDATVEVRFPDGQAPPVLNPDVWGPTAVDEQLREARYESLPERTLELLEELLHDEETP